MLNSVCQPSTLQLHNTLQPRPVLTYPFLLTYPFFHEETFLEFILDDGGVANLIELELFEEDVIWNFDWSAQAATALVVIENCLEGQVDDACIPTTNRQVMLRTCITSM